MRLLILGTGSMAAAHAQAFAVIDGVSVAGCVDLDRDRATAFAEAHGIPMVHTSLAEAVVEGYDAVANVTSDPAHFVTTMEALKGGLHVLCEKPLATNEADARTMTDTAERAGLINGVNLTYRNVAALQKAREIVADGQIGTICHFEASYLQSWLTQPAWGDWKTEERWLWRLSKEHGSNGVLGDIGIHILDFATFAAGSDIVASDARLKTFEKVPGNRIGEYKLDANDSMVMAAELASGATGVIHATRWASGHINDLSLRLYGDKGGLAITNEGTLGTVRICTGGDLESATWRDLPVTPVDTNYQRFAEAVRTGSQMQPNFRTAMRLQSVIDAALADETH